MSAMVISSTWTRSGSASRLSSRRRSKPARDRIHRLLAEGGKPLSPEQQEQETLRLEALLQDSGQQQKLLRDYQGDEDRIARIIALMPDGFIYQYDGVEGDDIRLKYQPNPDFKPTDLRGEGLSRHGRDGVDQCTGEAAEPS